MKIIANDGKDGFKSVEECLLYEKELARIEREQKEKEKEFQIKREKRLEAIREKDKELKDLIYQYEIDYGTRLCQFPDMSSLDYVIGYC